MAGQARALLKGKDIPRDEVIVPIDIVDEAIRLAATQKTIQSFRLRLHSSFRQCGMLLRSHLCGPAESRPLTKQCRNKLLAPFHFILEAI
jgi:hypothetical protein